MVDGDAEDEQHKEGRNSKGEEGSWRKKEKRKKKKKVDWKKNATFGPLSVLFFFIK